MRTFLVPLLASIPPLLGIVRITAFAMNRIVFGRKHEKSYVAAFAAGGAPALIASIVLLVPFLIAIGSGEYTPWAVAGAVWWVVASSIGGWWVGDRIHHLRKSPLPHHVRRLPPLHVSLHPAHDAPLREYGIPNDVYNLEITRHEIFVPGLPPSFDGYRIAFLSDTHVTKNLDAALFRACVAAIRAENVDLVLLGGDFVTWRRDIGLAADVLLRDLRARDGLYAVLGNHDYWSGADELRRAFESRGARFVINESIELRRGDDVLHLVGIDEIYRGEVDVDEAFARVPPGAPCIGISHHPDIIDCVRDRRIDLLVCGHTHGGQIRFPFFGAVIVPSKHEDRYAAGFFREGSVLMYVGRGIGAVPPVRILCRPELPMFTLRCESR